jgi:hypothetical protein
MIEVIFKIFLTDYIDFQGFITKRIQKPLLIEYIRVLRENIHTVVLHHVFKCTSISSMKIIAFS